MLEFILKNAARVQGRLLLSFKVDFYGNCLSEVKVRLLLERRSSLHNVRLKSVMCGLSDLAYVLEMLKLFTLVISDDGGLLSADGLDLCQFLQLDFDIVKRDFKLFVKATHCYELRGRV